MPRRQIVGSNLSLFAGPAPATGTHTTSNIKELFGVTTLSYDIAESREDISVLGTKIPQKISLESSAVTLDFSYYVSNFDNEKSLGLYTAGNSGAFVDLLNGTKDERNYFFMISSDGVDAIGASPLTTPCIGIGNGVINSYSFNAAVGSLPTATVSVSAIDIASYLDSDTEPLPAINVNTGLIAAGTFTLPTASGTLSGRDFVLRPRDVNVNLSGLTGLFYDLSSPCVQSFDIGVDFSRTNQQCLGSFYRKDSVMADLIPLTFGVEFLAKDMIAGRLSSFDCLTGVYSATASIRRPNCSGTGSVATTFTLRGLQFDSLNYSADAGGDASTVTLNFVGNIGGLTDISNGLFLSGITNN